MEMQNNIEIGLHNYLFSQLCEALHADILLNVMSRNAIGEHNNFFQSKSFREGNCFMVGEATLPSLYHMCKEVCESLNFTHPVDIYITGNAEINAHSIESTLEGEPHIIELNSGLLNLLNEAELRFVIGHEIGHLINSDSGLKSLIYFAYPEEESMPRYIHIRKVMYEHIAELAADRYGYVACKDLDACISVLYKLASGMDLTKLNVSIPSLIEENERHIHFFLNEKGEQFGNHPAVPLRVYAIHAFSSGDQDKIDQSLMDISACLLNQLLEVDLVHFLLSAGVQMALVDGSISEREYSCLVEIIGSNEIDPTSILDEWLKELPTDADERNQLFEATMTEAIGNIFAKYGLDSRVALLHHILKIMIADQNVIQPQIDLLFHIGNLLTLSDDEIAIEIASFFRTSYLPKVIGEN